MVLSALMATEPLAGAVVAAARQRALVLGEARGVVSHHGLGMSGQLEGARQIWVGSEAFASRRGVALPEKLRNRLAELSAEGQTTILVGENERVTGLLALVDEPRTGALAMVQTLRGMGIRPIVMVTGDHPEVARRIAQRLELDEAHAGLLPEEKLRVVKQLAVEHGTVGMVGDGVNDGPALATAHVAVTLGQASDVALEVADVVLVTNDLSRLPYAIELARKARRVVVQNLVLASAVILCGIPLAMFGAISLPVGVVLHEGSTLLVVANGLRLLRKL